MQRIVGEQLIAIHEIPCLTRISWQDFQDLQIGHGLNIGMNRVSSQTLQR